MPLFGCAVPTKLTRRWLPNKVEVKKTETEKEEEEKKNETEKKMSGRSGTGKEEEDKEEKKIAFGVANKPAKTETKKEEKHMGGMMKEEQVHWEEQRTQNEVESKRRGETEKKADKKKTEGNSSQVQMDWPLPRIGEAIHNCLIIDFLGQGAYGAVFRAKRSSDDADVAIKIELLTVKKKVLGMECKVLERCRRSVHFLTIHGKGRVIDRFSYVVMDRAGDSLWELMLATKDEKFSFSTTMQLGGQALAALRDLHTVGFLHRDVKSSNMMMGRQSTPKRHTLYIIDFGLARKFRDVRGEMRLQRQSAPFRGTYRYASITSQQRKEQARKDDLESWFYMLIELCQGALPWNDERESGAILTAKQEVLYGKKRKTWLAGLPKQLYIVYWYITSLQFASVPDYDYIHYAMCAAASAAGVNWKEPLDWSPMHVFEGPVYAPIECNADVRTGMSRGSTDSASKDKQE